MVNSILQSLGVARGDEPFCVQFVNTVGSRRSSTPKEYLKSHVELAAWMAKRGLVFAVDEAYRVRALQLRDSIYRVFSSIAIGVAGGAYDFDCINGELCEALAKLELQENLDWRLTEDDPGEKALMLIALSAAEVLTSPLKERIRECADETCGWVFIDLSKNRTRRWCSMSDCGNLAKARRYQARRKE